MSIKIRQLPRIPALDADDVLPVDDVSSTGVTTKGVTLGELAAFFGSGGYPEAEAEEAIAKGQPVYVKPNTHIALAHAGNAAAATVAGLAQADIAAGFAGGFSLQAIERDDWTVIAGSALLTPGQVYFLGSTPGTISVMAPATGHVVPFALAQTPNRLEFINGMRIRL